MPQIFRIGGYLVFFWANESLPLEPIHVHVSKGTPSASATKIWITKSGKCLLGNNNSNISATELRYIKATIEARVEDVLKKWKEFFGEVRYYC